MKYNNRNREINRFKVCLLFTTLALALVISVTAAQAASLPAGISDEVKKFFPDVYDYKNRPTWGLGSRAVLSIPAFMEVCKNIPEFKALIPSDIVKQLTDGSLENGEVKSFAVSHDNRLVTHINTPKGKFSVYRPISSKDADTFLAGAKWYRQKKSGKK